MSMRSCTVHVTIFSNSLLIPTGFKYTIYNSFLVSPLHTVGGQGQPIVGGGTKAWMPGDAPEWGIHHRAAACAGGSNPL